MKNKKFFSMLSVILVLSILVIPIGYANAVENTPVMPISAQIDKEDLYEICENLPHKYIDELYDAGIHYYMIRNINDQVKEYYLSDDEIEKYVKKITSDDSEGENQGDYPRDKDGNTITPDGTIPYQDIALKWNRFEVGDVRGRFIRWSKFLVKLHDKKTDKTNYIPVYDAGAYQSFCVEDLVNCGFSHSWDSETKTTNINYDGTTFTGLSKQDKTAGDIYQSDVKVYINGQSILTYNIGGYSLAEINGLRKILREDMDIEVVTADEVDLQHTDKDNVDSSNQDAALEQVRQKRFANRGSKVNVHIPDFKVTLNATIMDNQYNKYPCIVYNDITYFPMTYDYARFLGLKANWYEHSRMNEKGVLFVGVCDKAERQFKLNTITTNKKNKINYTAKIADYGLLVNSIKYSDLINNKAEEYPILNFRGISYFPLTWKYAVDEFGWKYAFDNERGLIIDADDPFKPVIFDKPIGYTLPHLPVAEYVYGDDYYIVLPHSTYSPIANLVYRKRGEKERVYDISEQLQNGEYAIVYLNMEKFLTDLGQVGFKESNPVVDGNILSVRCEGHNKSDNPKQPNWEEILIKINLDTGKIISEQLIE